MFERLRRHHAAIPLFVLFIGLLCSAVVSAQLQRVVEAKDRERFEHSVDQAHSSIRNRLETYIAMLQGGAGFLAAHLGGVDRDDFATYVDRLKLQSRYPGIQGIGYTVRVMAGETDELINAMRRQGVEEFDIWPAEPRPEYHSIVYLEPLDRRNKAAIGYDMFTNPVRRAAMERARDTGQPAASGKVELVQEIDERKQAGFLIYVPVYQGGGIPDSEAERRAALTGFVYSPFRADDLLHGIFGGERNPRLHFAVYDGAVLPRNLLHVSNPAQGAGPDGYTPRYTMTRPLEVAGRPWTISYATRPEFELSSSNWLVPFFLAGGVFATLLLSGVSWTQARARIAAERADQTMRIYARELETLNRTGAELGAELDLDRLVQYVTDAGTDLAGAEFGAFFYNVLNERGESYMLYALSGAPREAFAKFPMPRNTAVFGPTFRGEGVIRSDDILEDPRYGKNAPYRGMPEGHLPVRSYLAAPVISRSGEVLGGLFFGHAKPGMFTGRTERIIKGIASQTAIAIDNARLFQEAQTEIAERRRVEAHQKLLLDELNHRVKNTLAAVQSIAMQTLRSADSLEDFEQSFAARLLALSQAHNLLTRSNWQGASLRDILSEELAPYRQDDGSRFAIEGDEVLLRPNAAVALGMAFHELATNAAKHGSLSVPDGRVRVVWNAESASGNDRLCIRWIETGGPAVMPPHRRGFGSRLIERGLAHQLQGDVRLEFEPTGVRCIVDIPLADNAEIP